MEARKTLRQLLDEVELKDENIERIKDLLLGDGETAVIPHIEYRLDPNHFIYRARPHGPDRMFFERKDVSYVPDPKKVRTGRANMIGNRTFYGGFHTKEVKDGQVIAMQEASDMRNGAYPPVETFTVSRWRPKHRLSFAAFVSGEILASGTQVAREMYEATRDMIEGLPDRYRGHSSELHGVLHDEFTKEVNGDVEKYLISAVFSSIIYTQELGILYPSKRTDYKGLNVAVPADHWDANFDLVDCVIYQYHSADLDTMAIPYMYAKGTPEPFVWWEAETPVPKPPFRYESHRKVTV